LSAIVYITIPGNPHAQGRGRAVAMMVGRRMTARIYPENEDVEWRQRAQVWILEGLLAAGLEERAITGPVRVRIRAFFELPQSHRRVNAPPLRSWKVSRPDGDNLEKAVLDACEIVWKDDCQVVSCSWEKFVGAQDEPPRIEIEIEPITVDPNGKPLQVEKSLFEAPAATAEEP
jgi:Holliday junction resolvase RusA-like endonuclease